MSNEFSYLPIEKQTEKLVEICLLNPNLRNILETLKFPKNMPWYVVAGCINQTVWNYLTKRDIEYGIGDYDIVYWDEDVSKEAEVAIQKKVKLTLSDIDVAIEVVNQVRVPSWFEEDFGEKIKPYLNTEHAIGTWPTTATCVGITKTAGGYSVVAPYGLSDLFSMVLRPNIPIVAQDAFKGKVQKWVSKWPELKVIEPKPFI
jgi:uncharacterized protein